MVKIIVVVLICALVSVLLKTYKPEIASFFTLAVSLFVLCYLVTELEEIIEVIKTFGDKAKIPAAYMSILLKMVGISYLSEFASSLCKDAGQGTLGTNIETVARVSMLILSIPVLRSILDFIEEII